MRGFRRLAWLCGLLMVVSGARAGEAAEPVSLEPRWVVGETVRYELFQDTSESMMRDPENPSAAKSEKAMKLTWRLALTPREVAPERTVLDAKIEWIHAETKVGAMTDVYDTAEPETAKKSIMSNVLGVFDGAALTLTVLDRGETFEAEGIDALTNHAGTRTMGERTFGVEMMKRYWPVFAPRVGATSAEVGERWTHHYGGEVAGMSLRADIGVELTGVTDGLASMSLEDEGGAEVVIDEEFKAKLGDHAGIEYERWDVTGEAVWDTGAGRLVRFERAESSASKIDAPRRGEVFLEMRSTHSARLLEDAPAGPG